MDAAGVRYLYQDLSPAPEAATLSVRSGSDGDGPATYSSYSLLAQAMRPKTSSTNAGGVMLVRRTRHWRFWKALVDQAAAVGGAVLPCPSPQPGDRITDGAGTVWTVDSVDERLFGECWLVESTGEQT